MDVLEQHMEELRSKAEDDRVDVTSNYVKGVIQVMQVKNVQPEVLLMHGKYTVVCQRVAEAHNLIPEVSFSIPENSVWVTQSDQVNALITRLEGWKAFAAAPAPEDKNAG